MSVGRICTRVVATATPHERVRDAARRMAFHRVGALVVVGKDARPVGILTDRDVAIRCVAAGVDAVQAAVADVMTVPLETVSEETPIEDALVRMRAANTRRVVVVDRRGRLAGILALDDVLDLLAEEMDTIGKLLAAQEPLLPPGTAAPTQRPQLPARTRGAIPR